MAETVAELIARIDDLEARFAHQDAALEEMTRTLLVQERLLHEQAETLRRLEAQLRETMAASLATREREPPPPHY